MKKIMVFSVTALIVTWAFSVYNQSQYITNYPPKNSTIVAFGDSLVAGFGSSDNGGFVSILEKKIGKQIINMGVYGNTSAMGLGRLDSVIAKKPGVVMILFGGNDSLQGFSREETFANLHKMIDKLQANGSVVIILGIRNGILVDSNKLSFKKLAEDTGSLYVPDVLDGLFGNRRMMSDPVHPNDFGYEYIATKVLPELRKVLR